MKTNKTLKLLPSFTEGLSDWSRSQKELGLRITIIWVIDDVVRAVTGAPLRSNSQITPQLHIGGQYLKRGWPKMAARGIGAVVNLRAEFDDAQAGLAPDHYLYLPTVDDQSPSPEQLQQGIIFITEQIEKGRGVYVHCNAGASRSPTMAAAYLVSTGVSPNESWDYIRKVRPFILPKKEQVEIVERFAQDVCFK